MGALFGAYLSVETADDTFWFIIKYFEDEAAENIIWDLSERFENNRKWGEELSLQSVTTFLCGD